MSGPTKFNAQAREEFVGRVRAGGRRGATARAMNLSSRTVQKAKWRSDDSEPTAFGNAVLEAEREADEPVEDALYWQATLRADTASALKARIFWLTNRQSGRWPEAKALTTEVSGSVNSSVQHSLGLDPHAKKQVFDKINQMSTNLSRSRDLPACYQRCQRRRRSGSTQMTGHESARGVGPSLLRSRTRCQEKTPWVSWRATPSRVRMRLALPTDSFFVSGAIGEAGGCATPLTRAANSAPSAGI